MKRAQSLIFLIPICLIVIFFVWFFLIRIDKIAYIDSAKILQEYTGAVKVRKLFEEKTSGWKANVDTLTNEVKNAMTDYEQNAGKSKVSNDAARKAIAEKQQQLAKYQQTIQENARQEDLKITEQVIAEINKFLKEYGAKHRYQYILVAGQSGTIAYAKDGLDITEDVLNELNKAYEASN